MGHCLWSPQYSIKKCNGNGVTDACIGRYSMADSIMSEASTVPRKATMTRATITTTKTPVRYANRAERVKEMCAGSLGWFESKSIVLSKYCSHATNCSASRLSKAWEISGVRTGLGSEGGRDVSGLPQVLQQRHWWSRSRCSLHIEAARRHWVLSCVLSCSIASI